MHTLANPRTRPQRDWSSFYAPGHEIQAHLQEIVDKHKLMRHIKLQHEVVHARYDEQAGKWHVRIRCPKPGGSEGETEEFEDVGVEMTVKVGRGYLRMR